jgi:hypothetical protein
MPCSILVRRSTAEGSVRNAMVYRALSVTKSAKHYIETGLSLDGVETSAEDAAVAASKGKCNKRDRFPYPRRTINITFVTPCYSPN